MAIPKTIAEDYEKGLQLKTSHRTFNNSVVVNYLNNDEKIRIPMDSLISKYADLFDKYVIDQEITEEDAMMFRYSPKMLSERLYGTTQYWSIILYLNDCHSITEFAPEKSIKVIKPEYIDELINEALILERKI